MLVYGNLGDRVPFLMRLRLNRRSAQADKGISLVRRMLKLFVRVAAGLVSETVLHAKHRHSVE